jgi:hypothetical protein
MTSGQFTAAARNRSRSRRALHVSETVMANSTATSNHSTEPV